MCARRKLIFFFYFLVSCWVTENRYVWRFNRTSIFRVSPAKFIFNFQEQRLILIYIFYLNDAWNRYLNKRYSADGGFFLAIVCFVAIFCCPMTVAWRKCELYWCNLFTHTSFKRYTYVSIFYLRWWIEISSLSTQLRDTRITSKKFAFCKTTDIFARVNIFQPSRQSLK